MHIVKKINYPLGTIFKYDTCNSYYVGHFKFHDPYKGGSLWSMYLGSN